MNQRLKAKHTRASQTICRSYPECIECKHVLKIRRWMRLTTQTWGIHFQLKCPRERKRGRQMRYHHKLKKIHLKSVNFSCELTCAMAYSHRRFRPSNKYWSAARRSSCAISKLTSTEPVYMYLNPITDQFQDLSIEWYNWFITYNDRTLSGYNPKYLPHHQLKDIPSDIWDLYVFGIPLLQHYVKFLEY